MNCMEKHTWRVKVFLVSMVVLLNSDLVVWVNIMAYLETKTKKVVLLAPCRNIN